jgi:hypothetical protein
MVFKIPRKGESWRDVFPRRHSPLPWGGGVTIYVMGRASAVRLYPNAESVGNSISDRDRRAICQLPSMVYLWRGKTDMTRCGNVG